MSASEELRRLEARVRRLEAIVRRQGDQLRYFERLEDTNADNLFPPAGVVRLPDGRIQFREEER